MNTKDKIRNISALNAAIVELQGATKPLDKITASQRLIDLLRSMGLYEPSIEIDTDAETDAETDADKYSNNPNDENYRYADTGYIAGAHKELAGNRIKELAKDGLTVKSTDIEWDEIESDALFAESMIKKSNIMGNIDYQAMQDKNMRAGTAFLIQKVFASIAVDPHWDVMTYLKNSNGGKRIARGGHNTMLLIATHYAAIPIADQKALARKAYVNGINTLKSRLTNNENIIDERSLVSELKDIAHELGGHRVSAAEEGDYNLLLKKVETQKQAIIDRSKIFESEYKAVEARVIEDSGEKVTNGSQYVEYSNGTFAIKKGMGGYWVHHASMQKWLAEQHPDVNFADRYSRDLAPIAVDEDMNLYYEYVKEAESLALASKLAALSDPLSSLAWVALGERFWNIVELQSDAFIKHANLAIKNKYEDWSLLIKPKADKSGEAEEPKGKKKTTFELIVADNIQRKGGDPVTIRSTEELKNAFGFRDIQSGTWVLNDKTSAKFHVENAAAAMMDLSDIVGIDPKSLAFGGRLALAIGARGRSGALAHYEPVQRVINITKMKGGGSLGHEWFHSIDNILGEVLGANGATGVGNYLTIDPSLISNELPELEYALTALQDAMMIGDIKSPEVFNITEKDIKRALLNIKPDMSISVRGAIASAKDAQEAVERVDKQMGSLFASKMSKNHKEWRKIAVAYHNQDNKGEKIYLNTGETVSQFYSDAKQLDTTRSKPYWSTTHEMAARAFQAFLEDSLKDQDRRNDYLSYGASNDLYGGIHKAYPEGEERKRINLAFKNLFQVIKTHKVFENASADSAMMDAIFGPYSDNNYILDNDFKFFAE